MGLFDSIRSVFGLSAEADATRDADPEDLFGMSTAYVTMEADLDFVPVGAAALCFSSVASTDFAAAVDEETGCVTELGHSHARLRLSGPSVRDLLMQEIAIGEG